MPGIRWHRCAGHGPKVPSGRTALVTVAAQGPPRLLSLVSGDPGAAGIVGVNPQPGKGLLSPSPSTFWFCWQDTQLSTEHGQ